jgi:hypothetical protein
MSSMPRGPRTSLGQAAVPSIGTPPIGAPLADPLGELEVAAERVERWAKATRYREQASPDRGCGPTGETRGLELNRQDAGES